MFTQTVWRYDLKVKVKVEVYSLVSSAKRYSPDFTQLRPGHRTCSFISHLNSPGSIQPGCHFGRTELFKHTSLHCPTRYPLTPGSRECTCEQSALPRSTTSKHTQRSRGSNPQSLACKSRTVPLSHDAPLYVTSMVRRHDVNPRWTPDETRIELVSSSQVKFIKLAVCRSKKYMLITVLVLKQNKPPNWDPKGLRVTVTGPAVGRLGW